MEQREAWLARTFVELSDTLVADFDLSELCGTLVERCATLLEGREVALTLADPAGVLRFAAASTDEARRIELTELRVARGPALDAYRGAAQVLNREPRAEAARWPAFARAAHEAGYALVHALPVRLRTQTLGALEILDRSAGSIAPVEVELAQALTNVTAIALLQERAKHRDSELAAQLQLALTSRIAVEQAKGVLAERLDIDVDTAFGLLRSHARCTARQLDEVARGVLERTISAETLFAAARPVARPR